MQLKVVEVNTCHLYRAQKDGSSNTFAGMKVVVKLSDGKVIKFKTDYIMVRPRLVINQVISHVFTRSGLPDGVLELVTLV